MIKILASILIFSFVSQNNAKAVVWYPQPKEAYHFAKKYPEAQSLLYAFDYGHALVYERLLLNRGNILDPEKFEQDILKEVIEILKNPPVVKIEEDDIAPYYSFTFPLTITLFDWSHLLHQFVLDIMSQNIDRNTVMKDRIANVFAQYKNNKSIAITDVCKTMLFMDGHYFSKSFRRSYPSFNLLIWSYHWFQTKLYEDLMADTEKQRDINVAKTLKEFWSLLSDLPDSADFDMMPEVFDVAPKFSNMFPLVGASFDNNHMLHDVVSDILTSDRVPNDKIKSEGIRFGRMAMDPVPYASASCL